VKRAAALIASVAVLAGCAHQPSQSQPPPRPKPNSNQTADENVP